MRRLAEKIEEAARAGPRYSADLDIFHDRQDRAA